MQQDTTPSPLSARHFGRPVSTPQQLRRRRQYLSGIFGASTLISASLFLGFLFVPTGDRFVLKLHESDLSGTSIILPKFSGRDRQGQAFTISADAAALDTETKNITLTALAFANAKGVKIWADSGLYEQAKNILHLEGGVRMSDRWGQDFRTPKAMMNLRNGEIEGVEPISGNSRFGYISANRFKIHKGGQWVALDGRVRTRLNVESR